MKKKKVVSKVYKRLPKGYHFIDNARSLTQARTLKKGQPKDARAVIVQTGKNKGKDKVVFPYHILSNNRDY